MKKGLKRAVVLFLMLALVISCFSACGGKDGGDEKENLPVTELPEIDEPVTLTILTTRHTGATTDAKDLWFFKYMEYWFAQLGYDVTINVQQTTEVSQQESLLLSTDSLPDIAWGLGIGRTNIMKYGVEEGMLLDWTPYLNESMMPNLCKRFEEVPEAKVGATAPDGGVYGLPYFAPSQYASGCYGTSERLYFRQSWLDACGVKNPTTQEEFLDVLRAFKKMKTDAATSVPLVSAGSFLEKYLWTCLGFYGTEPSKYGSTLMIKDGKLELPAYTESYRDFITMMHTMYSEGLVAKDYFSMSEATAGGLMRDNACGALAWWTLEYVGEDFADIVCANPIPMGGNKDIYVSRLPYYSSYYMWASADTKYPELVALMLDFVYSEEGAFTYRYGPEKGKDPLNLVEGWYKDENGDITTEMVENGTYDTITAYGRDRLYPFDNAGLRPAMVTSGTGDYLEFTDAVTGEKYTCIDNIKLDDNTNDGHWRLITIDKWSDHATSIRLHGSYLDSDTMNEASDLITVLQNYITKESAKFITGQRDLSEIDAFWKELEGLGVERYLEINRDSSADFFTETFGK